METKRENASQKRTPYQGSKQHSENAVRAGRLGRLAVTRLRQERVDAYQKNPRICERPGCGDSIAYEKKANRFCGSRCAALHNTAKRDCSHSAEGREKIKNSLLMRSVNAGRRVLLTDGVSYKFERICPSCSNLFLTDHRNTRTCSLACANKLSSQTIDKEKQREKSRESIKRLMAEGRWKGWNGRGTPSFPESYIASLLRARSVNFESEYQVDRFSLDFALPDLKIDFEVDGKQHDYPDRKKHDAMRDEFMKDRGWVVFRLKWFSVKKEDGRSKVHEQFEEFMKLLEARSIDFQLKS